MRPRVSAFAAVLLVLCATVPIAGAPTGGVLRVDDVQPRSRNSFPDPAYSSVAWSGAVCGGDKVFICPAGDGTALVATILDEFAVPIEGVPVTLTLDAACAMCLCPPTTVETDPSGVAAIPIHGGLDVSIGTNCCVVTATVTCVGVTIPWEVTGLLSDTRDWLSVDMNADCIVGPDDLALANIDLATDACRTDYDCDGQITIADLVFLMEHATHQCDPTVPEPEIDVAPDSLAFVLLPHTDDCDTLVISNSGDAPLEYTIAETCAWLVINTSSGTIPPDGFHEIEVCASAAEQPPGDHTYPLVITSNDSDEPATTVAVTLTVLTQTDIAVDPTSLFFEVYPNHTACAMVVVTNEGTADLTWSLTEDCAWLTVDSSGGVLEPGNSVNVEFCVDAAGLPPDVYVCDSAVITSNDPDEPEMPVAVTMTILHAAGIQVVPTTLSFLVPGGTTVCDTVVISNTGSADLSWWVHHIWDPWLTMDPDDGIIPPGGHEGVAVCCSMMNWTQWGLSDGLEIGSNDPDQPIITVQIFAENIPMPDITISPEDSLDLGVAVAGPAPVVCETLWIGNNGYEDLIWTIADTCDWLSAEPAAGTTARDDTIPVLICADASDLPLGDYACDLTIASDDPDEPEESVVVTVTVAAHAPEIEISTEIIEIHLVGHGSACDTLTIWNTGYANLTWQFDNTCESLYVRPGHGNVPPGQTDIVHVCVDGTELTTGSWECTMTLLSNDEDEGAIEIEITVDVQIPDMSYSHAAWQGLMCGDTVGFACPQGDGTALSVSIHDDTDQPIAGAHVVPAIHTDCDVCLCEPIAATTGPDGIAILPIHGGLDVSDGPECCELTASVTCLGETVPWGGPGGPSADTRSWLSPDLDGDCMVGASDYAIFSSDYITDACRTDYNCDGIVDALDLGTYGGHNGHVCEPPVSGIDDGDIEIPPSAAMLEQNYPNPFNPTTRIAFAVAEAGAVVLRIYDAAGRPVRLAPGRYNEAWDGHDDHGRRVGSGVYFCRLEIDRRLETKKMVLLK